MPVDDVTNYFGCLTCVPQQNVAVIERCGKFQRFGLPGLNLVWCCIGELVSGQLSLRIQQLDVRCETKTIDNVFVYLTISVQYKVSAEEHAGVGASLEGDSLHTSLLGSSPTLDERTLYDAFYKLTNSEQQMRAYVFDVVRSTVPKMKLDEVFETKEEIASRVESELSKAMASFGYSIIQTLITDIDPDHRVKSAMNDINAAQRTRMAAVEQAEAAKIKVVKAAEADAEAKYLEGQGIARQRQAIIAGLKESVVQFSEDVHGVASADVIEMMMMTQYFDTLRSIGLSNTSSTIFLNHSPGAIADVGTSIRDGILAASRVGAQSAPAQQSLQR